MGVPRGWACPPSRRLPFEAAGLEKGIQKEKTLNNDLKILKYVKRLLNRYERTQVLKERLMLNHLIMLGNVFPVKVLVRILFLKIPVQYWSELKTFLIFLNYMPEKIESINGRSIISSDIQINLDIANKLREI